MKYLVFIATIIILSTFIFASDTFVNKDSSESLDIITDETYKSVDEFNSDIDFELSEENPLKYWFSLSIIEKIFSTSILLFTGLAIIVLAL